MYRSPLSPEQLRSARPDCVTHIGQLIAGQVVISFDTYFDLEGNFNPHTGRVAVLSGSAYRIRDGEIIDRGVGLDECMRVEPLPAHTRATNTYEDQAWLRVGRKGIEGIDESNQPAGLSRGLLVVREEPYRSDLNLEVGPGLYVNGANDYHTLFRGQHMAVFLDSNPHLSGHL